MQQWQSDTVTLVEIDENKHKLLNLTLSGPNGEMSLQFNAGSKDTAESIVAKIESSRRLAGGDTPQKANGVTRSPSPPTIKSPTPAVASSGGSRLLPPAHPGTTPSPSGRSRGVHFDPAPPVEIAHPHHEDIEEEEEDDHRKSPGGDDAAVAIYDFDADGDDELTVKEGEKITVLDREGSEEWWKCRNDAGKEGVVPASYLEVSPVDDRAHSLLVTNSLSARYPRRSYGRPLRRSQGRR